MNEDDYKTLDPDEYEGGLTRNARRPFRGCIDISWARFHQVAGPEQPWPTSEQLLVKAKTPPDASGKQQETKERK